MACAIPARTYLTHGFDRYPAKMIPHLARWAIERYSVPGEAVLDPFCGSATTGVVALKNNRKFVGIDSERTYLNRIAIPRIRDVLELSDSSKHKKACELVL